MSTLDDYTSRESKLKVCAVICWVHEWMWSVVKKKKTKQVFHPGGCAGAPVGSGELPQIVRASVEAGSSPGLRAGWAAGQCKGRPADLMEELLNWDRLISNTVTFV